MDPGPPELEERYRRFLESRGDAIAPLLCYLRGDRGARADTGAWAALIVSRILLLKGNIPLADSYLRLAAALSSAAGDARLRLGILVNRALILKAQGRMLEASQLLRAVVDRALRSDETFVAAKAASNLALCMARRGDARDALPYLGIADTYHSAIGCKSGLIRASMTRALLDAKQGMLDEAVDRLCLVVRECVGERHARERAVGLLLVAELSLSRADMARAREALDGAASMPETLTRFGPQRLQWLRLEHEYHRQSGNGDESRRFGEIAERLGRRMGVACAYDALERPDARAPSLARESAPYMVVGSCGLEPVRTPVPGLGDDPSKTLAEVFVTCDPRMKGLLEEIERAARLSLPVLILGESGTGKDLIARLVHRWSGREREPFVPVNVAALPADLFESMAFGHARGAFTGAVENRMGLAGAAGRGTLFLDEIGEISPAVQAKLLRLLDRREYLPLGETRPRRFEARVVAATNRDLRVDCASGRIRADLYYRLAPLVFRIPPLRERPADIAYLALYFAERLRALHGIGPATLHESALAALAGYGWPGNARELESEVLRGALAAKGSAIRACHLSPAVMMSLARDASSAHAANTDRGPRPAGCDLAARLNSFRTDEILDALRACGGNRTSAARRLGLKRTTLLSSMRRLGIEY